MLLKVYFRNSVSDRQEKYALASVRRASARRAKGEVPDRAFILAN